MAAALKLKRKPVGILAGTYVRFAHVRLGDRRRPQRLGIIEDFRNRFGSGPYEVLEVYHPTDSPTSTWIRLKCNRDISFTPDWFLPAKAKGSIR